MLGSREAFVNYTMPLGLHHLIGGDHYAADAREQRSAAAGLDRDLLPQRRRRRASASTARAPAAAPSTSTPRRSADAWDDPATTPEALLLWFHRLPWDYRLASGQTLWEGIVAHYQKGAGAGRADGEGLGGARRARWTTSGTRRSPPSCGSRPGRGRLARQVPHLLRAVQQAADRGGHGAVRRTVSRRARICPPLRTAPYRDSSIGGPRRLADRAGAPAPARAWNRPPCPNPQSGVDRTWSGPADGGTSAPSH